jgi:hypothetical protein
MYSREPAAVYSWRRGPVDIIKSFNARVQGRLHVSGTVTWNPLDCS